MAYLAQLKTINKHNYEKVRKLLIEQKKDGEPDKEALQNNLAFIFSLHRVCHKEPN